MINILEYGAVGDGQTNDAPVIQKAIDTCAEQGGGVVLFPGGRTYSSGYVLLKSNVEVHLEPGAVWKASSNIEDYYPLRNNGKITAHESGLPSFLNSEYAGRPFHAFIYALGQENVTISGQGTIDGNESVFYGDDSGGFLLSQSSAPAIGGCKASDHQGSPPDELCLLDSASGRL